MPLSFHPMLHCALGFPFLLPPTHTGAEIIEEIPRLPVVVEYRQGNTTRYEIALTIFQEEACTALPVLVLNHDRAGSTEGSVVLSHNRAGAGPPTRSQPNV